MTIETSQKLSLRALARSMMIQSSALAGCAGETVELFCEHGQIKRFADGEILATRGYEVQSLIFVIEGSIEIGMFTVQGKRFIARYVAPGQLLGVIPIIDGGSAIHDVQAHGEIAALLIPRKTFSEAIASDPGLAQALLRLLCTRSRARYDDAAANAIAPVRVRVARTLLSLLPAYGVQRGNTVRIELRLSQEEFAALVGVSRQCVNRQMSEFRRMGVISTSYSRIEVVDYTALQNLSSLDLWAE
ncbi:Crp/Fnr family transcriptional regulator [Paraburkholderia sp. ZP32-5]|uniref:Crp/Fnr family transcriptional regulator n=1 Tax=Paraburkholderia sp. ZP32-5 TaxID=2883245 RepID=UPI001F300BAC|nr:Crp/Fnr family transcriptional regulator [Paraburkholderia sp. ZP32-5]